MTMGDLRSMNVRGRETDAQRSKCLVAIADTHSGKVLVTHASLLAPAARTRRGFQP
jgi:hypothetical protein